MGNSAHDLRGEVLEYLEHGARFEKGSVVFDVGANVGAFACLAAEETGGDLQLHCFEPAAPLFRTLTETCDAHDLLRKARPRLYRLALSKAANEGKSANFYYFKHFPTDSTYDIENKRDEFRQFFQKKRPLLEETFARVPIFGAFVGTRVSYVLGELCRRDSKLGTWLSDICTGLTVIRCELSTIETIAKRAGIEKISLLKIDVEGAELDVLEGVGSFWPNVDQVAIETFDEGDRVERILAILRTAGFESVTRATPRIASSTLLPNVLLVARKN